MADALNVFGMPLEPCCFDPMTGYMRDGFCQIISGDQGTHIICCMMTADFLDFSKSRGNDLSTPHPEWNFPGLKEGDRWCLCALRWMEALHFGMAPKVVLEATHEKMLDYTELDVLVAHAFTKASSN